jgi:hypothetical protein
MLLQLNALAGEPGPVVQSSSLLRFGCQIDTQQSATM